MFYIIENTFSSAYEVEFSPAHISWFRIVYARMQALIGHAALTAGQFYMFLFGSIFSV
jgi:hypothetical protein